MKCCKTCANWDDYSNQPCPECGFIDCKCDLEYDMLGGCSEILKGVLPNENTEYLVTNEKFKCIFYKGK